MKYKTPKNQKATDERIKIGAILQKYRTQCNYTQTEIAEKLGITRQAYSKIERGDAPLKPEYARILATLYKIQVSMLILEKTDIDIKMTDEIDVYKPVVITGGELPKGEKVHCFHKEMINTSAGEAERTYRVDEGLRGINPTDLYALEVTDTDNVLNLPLGSKIIIQHVDREHVPTIDKPTYLVLEITKEIKSVDPNNPIEEALGGPTVTNEFIALVTPLRNLSRNLTEDGRYKRLYKFAYPDGNEFYMETSTLAMVCRGIVKKVIIDYLK